MILPFNIFIRKCKSLMKQDVTQYYKTIVTHIFQLPPIL